MPRGKLCGEFVTPEAFPSLDRLGVMTAMREAGARMLTRLSLVVESGKAVQTSIGSMSEVGDCALSLSRARFDQILFERAKSVGAECLEGFAVKECLTEDGRACGVEALSLSDGTPVSFFAPLIIDASGRNSRFMLSRSERRAGIPGSRLYGLKAHLANVTGLEEQVELYFFPQGYGGLSRVENGLVNLCFIANERTFRAAAGDPDRIVERTVMRNRLARERLERAEVSGKWYSVGPLSFGHRRHGRNGVLAIGDAGGMIDPFTGTGIQMALRTGELAAAAVINGLSNKSTAESVMAGYARSYAGEFGDRLKVAGWLRKVAFSPLLASSFASILALSPGLTRSLLRATRTGPRKSA
jgi:flavin-dependent dehydrogenase